MAKAKDGRANNDGSQNLNPPIKDTDDPRYLKLAAGRDAYNKRRQEAAARRKEYELSLKEFKGQQFEEAQLNISEGRVDGPTEMLMKMIEEQTLAVSNPGLTTNELLKEKEMLMKLWDRYSTLTGANAPSASQIDVTSTDTSEATPESIDEELKKFTGKVIKL